VIAEEPVPMNCGTKEIVAKKTTIRASIKSVYIQPA
jgi:hypothetical protein